MIATMGAESAVFVPFFSNQGLRVFWETFFYGSFVAMGSSIFGFSWGFICANYDFPGRRLLLWLLPAPLAIPVYIYAFIYLSLWQQFVSYQKPHWLFLLVFCFSTYPYAFLLSLVSFQKRSKSLEESLRILGLGRLGYLKNLHWPVMKPLFVSSFLLIFFEYLSDFGASQIFGIQTLSTVIYKIWNAYFSFGTAALLSLLLIIVVICCLFLSSFRNEVTFPSEVFKRKQAAYPNLILGAGLCTVFLSFALPFGVLVYLGVNEIFSFQDRGSLLQAIENSLILSLSFSLVVVLFLSFSIFSFRRNERSLRLFRILTQFGYAVPGTALAVAVTIPFFYLQRSFDGFSRSVTVAIGLMFLAWLVRFFKVGWDSMDKSRLQFSESLEEVAQIYEGHGIKRWYRFYYPLISSGMGISFLFLFLETLKELPVVLLTRPFGWDNLSVRFFEFSSESDWAKAAPYGLVIVIFGMIGNFILIRKDPRS